MHGDLAAFSSTPATSDATPGPFGLKVVERRQRGVPVSSLVCSAEPGDCPAGRSRDTNVVDARLKDRARVAV